MPASNRDPWSQTSAGAVRGSASRTGLPGTRSDVSPSSFKQVPAGEATRIENPTQLVGRDSGTDGKMRNTHNMPINPGTKNWQPLSDMTEKRPAPMGPDSAEKLVPEADERAREDIAVSKSELGQPEGTVQRNLDIIEGPMPSDRTRAVKQSQGQAVGETHINDTPSSRVVRASEGGYDPHLTGSYDSHISGATKKLTMGGSTKETKFGAMVREDE